MFIHDCEILVPVSTEEFNYSPQQLQTCLASLTEAKVRVLTDDHLSLELKNIVQSFPNMSLEYTNELYVWDKLRYGVESSKKHFVAICEPWDCFIEGKILLQRRVMQNDYPQSPISFSAYMTNNRIQFPIRDNIRGAIHLLPSTWMINRELLSMFTISTLNPSFYKSWGVAMAICQQSPQIPVIALPLVVHNIEPKQIRHYAKLSHKTYSTIEAYCQDFLEPNLIYYYPKLTDAFIPTEFDSPLYAQKQLWVQWYQQEYPKEKHLKFEDWLQHKKGDK